MHIERPIGGADHPAHGALGHAMIPDNTIDSGRNLGAVGQRHGQGIDVGKTAYA